MNEQWFLEERGIRKDTLDAFGVRFLGKEVIFPYPTGDKTRYWDEEGKRQFRFTKGMKPALFGPRPKDVGVLFLCEGETDTMRLWQELKDADSTAGVLGIGGVDTWRTLPDYEKQGLMSFERIYLILDNDADYNTKHHVDQVAMDIRKEFGVNRVQRIRLPDEVKDICEFFDAGYNVESLRLLRQKGKSVSRFKPLDLKVDPPPINWLLDGLVAKSHLTLFSGPSGIGKSWATLGLAQAVADGSEEFLGRRVYESGRVLYFDEENPVDVVYDRLNRLGLKNKENIRYIWNNGVRLDRIADVALDEALDYEPVLIVIDAMTRVHSQDENSAGQMAPFLNECIKPLARETGSAVIMIHHHDKANLGPRGSGDIYATPDCVLECEGNREGFFNIKLSKSRLRVGGKRYGVRIVDNPADGSVILQGEMADIEF